MSSWLVPVISVTSQVPMTAFFHSALLSPPQPTRAKQRVATHAMAANIFNFDFIVHFLSP